MYSPVIIFNFKSNDQVVTEEHVNGLTLINVDPNRLQENLNPKQLNENKFFGTIASYFTTHDVIVVPCENGSSYINKGNNRVISEIKWRLKLDKTFVPSVITLSAPRDVSVWYTKDTNCARATDLDALKAQMSSITRDESRVPVFGGKITCGLVCQTTDDRVGHVTIAYNIDSTVGNELFATHGNNCGSTVTGTEIKFSTVNGDKVVCAGSVIYLPSLKIEGVAHPHITCNSTIKAVLSAKIVEQYLVGKLEFPLSEIDPTNKQATIIRIEADATNSDIRIIDWYSYYLN